MKNIDEVSRLDDDRQLHILVDQPVDSFANPGAASEAKWIATGLYYLHIPDYSWPLSVFWNANSLQFATHATALAIADRIRAELGQGYRVGLYREDVNVGPFTWREKFMLRVTAPDGTTSEAINAGLEASTYARHPHGYRKALLERLNLQ
jgi:hypothetical protein